MDRFFGLFSTWSAENSLDTVDACMPLTEVCPPQLIKQLDIMIALVHIVVVFLASIQQGKALEYTLLPLNSMNTNCHIIPEASKK